MLVAGSLLIGAGIILGFFLLVGSLWSTGPVSMASYFLTLGLPVMLIILGWMLLRQRRFNTNRRLVRHINPPLTMLLTLLILVIILFVLFTRLRANLG